MRRALTTALLATLATTGCDLGKSVLPAVPSTAPGQTARVVTPAPGASYAIAINYPDPGATEKGSDILLSVTVTGLQVAPGPGSTGHIVYYLDVPELPTAAGSSALDVTRGKAVASSATAYTWRGVSPGKHRLAVQLVGRDDAPLKPPASDEIEMRLER